MICYVCNKTKTMYPRTTISNTSTNYVHHNFNFCQKYFFNLDLKQNIFKLFNDKTNLPNNYAEKVYKVCDFLKNKNIPYVDINIFKDISRQEKINKILSGVDKDLIELVYAKIIIQHTFNHKSFIINFIRKRRTHIILEIYDNKLNTTIQRKEIKHIKELNSIINFLYRNKLSLKEILNREDILPEKIKNYIINSKFITDDILNMNFLLFTFNKENGLFFMFYKDKNIYSYIDFVSIDTIYLNCEICSTSSKTNEIVKHLL
jgi:hypothetical protein